LPEPKREELKVHARKAVLVSVLDRRERSNGSHPLDEMQGLAETAGAEIVGTLVQVKEKPDPATYLGKGKVRELKQLVQDVGADLIVFDNHLSPSQGKNIEEETGTQVVDRSEVILDIFATHARTYESKLQVELAQLLYMRPRLTRMWSHLERIEGGIGSGKGPGEKQLETDRRLVDRRISELQRKLKDVESRRERLVAGRKGHKMDDSALGRRSPVGHRRIHQGSATPPGGVVPLDAGRSASRGRAVACRRCQPS
jgi:GTP-binding protein HflX